MTGPRTLEVWIPSNRKTETGRPRGLDGWNEILTAYKSNRYAGNKREQQNVAHCKRFIRLAMLKHGWPPMEYEASAVPCRVRLDFFESNKKRDVPNVFGANKYLLDALSRPRVTDKSTKDGAAAIYDDSPRWLTSIEMSVDYDRHRPGVLVTVTREEE